MPVDPSTGMMNVCRPELPNTQETLPADMLERLVPTTQNYYWGPGAALYVPPGSSQQLTLAQAMG